MEKKFTLSACAEMLWRDKPIEWRCERLSELDFQVGLWNWPNYDLQKLKQTSSEFSIMNGYLRGCLIDPEGKKELLKTAKETVIVAKHLGVSRLNFHGTGLDNYGVPLRRYIMTTQKMWDSAYETLNLLCDMVRFEEVTLTLENLNPFEHPGCPFNSPDEVLSLVSAINRPELKINLDLYHAHRSGDRIIQTCEKCLPWLGEVQIADNPGRCEPGTGEMDYESIATALLNMGYKGPVGMEAYGIIDSDTALETFRRIFSK